MISKKGILKTIASCLFISALFMLFFIGCDKRKAMDSEELNEEQITTLVDDIFISLDPPQINLPTSSAIDSSRVTIAVVDTEGVGIPGVRVSITRNPQIGYLTAPDTTNSFGVTSALFVAQPGVYGVANIRVTIDTLIRTTALYITGPSEYSRSLWACPQESTSRVRSRPYRSPPASSRKLRRLDDWRRSVRLFHPSRRPPGAGGRPALCTSAPCREEPPRCA